MSSFIHINSKKCSVEHFKEIDSTNTYLKNKMLSHDIDIDVAIADAQTNGKGRLGRKFYSDEKCGLYFSFRLKKEMIIEPMLITVTAAVAVHNAILKVIGVSCDIKWVNDLYYNKRKVCGILTETVFDSDNYPKFAVIGIGVNICLPSSGYNEEIKNIAGAISDNYSEATRDKLAFEIIHQYLTLTNINREELHSAYLNRMFIIGRNVTVNNGVDSYTAEVVSLRDDFGLVVKKDTGELVILKSGEISIKL